jgi:lysyl-tRNA synthetase class 2
MSQAENGPGDRDLVQQRITKLERLRSRGIDPYPARFDRSHTAAAVHEAMAGTEGEGTTVSVGGRVIAVRGMGKLTFVVLLDGTGEVQVSFQRDTLGTEQYQLLKEIDLGDFLGVAGSLYRTRTDEDTVQAGSFTVLSKALRPPPEKWHGVRDVEQRYRQRYLDLMGNAEVRDLFTKRSEAVAAVRGFMQERGFLEVETPMLLPLAAGAMAAPFETHHRALNRRLFLRIATELHLKRLVVGGFERVYEIGRIFRNEGIDASHNPEFTTMESYEAYADYRDVMEMVEQLVSSVAQRVTGAMIVAHGDQQIDLAPPWKRLSLIDAVREWSDGIDLLDDQFRSTDGLRSAMRERGLTPAEGTSWPQLADKLVSDLVEPRLEQPTFLVDYPIEMTPLAKAIPGEPRLVERFEAFARGMEIANSFTELNDPIEQRARLEAQENARRDFASDDFDRLDEDFLVAMEHGMPPTGGLGIGIDRLVMLLTGQSNIREVVLFPQLRSLE